MNHNEFVQALKAGKVSGAYLFEGVEENIKSVTLAALRKAVLADGMAELNESVMENPSAGEIIAACETLPFASDKRLVVVRELNGTTGRSEAEERLVSYIPKVPDSCVLVIYVRGKADGRKKLYSAVKKKGGHRIVRAAGGCGAERVDCPRVPAEREEVRAGRGEPFVLHGRQ